MGVAPYKTFTFDGVSSANYGVYLTGVGVYNAPKRSVEMLSIAGRNGDYALDQGKFENVSVTYRVGMYDTDENNFATKVSNFRNWLCSKVGYVRLEDEYNPNEYRMAVYKDGFELEHDMLIAGEAEITFECKPQRWLTSGETATAVANNGTLSNPTLFDSEPLLAVKGYGTIGFNGYEIEIGNVTIGDVTLYDGGSISSTGITFDESQFNVGDTITVNGIMQTQRLRIDSTQALQPKRVSNTLTCTNSDFSVVDAYGPKVDTGKYSISVVTATPHVHFVVGTSSTITNTVSGTFTYDLSPSVTITLSYTQNFIYDASTHTIKFTVTSKSASSSQTWCTISNWYTNSASCTNIIGTSTKSAVSGTVYIDCDIGECWTTQGGQIVSLNGVISLGSDLPKLASGTNTFTYDNTVTELKVTPRWWKV